MFTEKQIGDTTYWYDPALLTESVEQAFSIEFWKQQEAVLGYAKGRGTTWFVQGEKLAFALRHYRRGGLFGKLIEDKYYFSNLQQTRPYQEIHVLDSLIRSGVNVPRPIAARVKKGALTYQADILVELLSGAKDLVAILQSGPLSIESLTSIGREVRKMHDARINHTDLNIHNIMIDKKGKVWIIDFDKCYLQQRGRNWEEDNLKRLKRSFEKERLKHHLSFSEANWKSLLSAYRSGENSVLRK
ncbi:3-deoxy-D-manno-octulosonic acid kinase [Vibrio paucivorans]